MSEIARTFSRECVLKRMRQTRHSQQGVVLFISLIILVAMTLAGIALIRAVDVNIVLAGNLAFREGATMASDRGIEQARQKIVTYGLDPAWYNDVSSEGYYATWQTGFDPRGWAGWNQASGSGIITLAADSAGYTTSYVIHRMCNSSGNPSGTIGCVKAGVSGTLASSFGSQSYSNYALQLQGQIPVYRVTARVLGPKNTISYIQVVVIP
jgi:Tfp pilus assembly protein PilX